MSESIQHIVDNPVLVGLTLILLGVALHEYSRHLLYGITDFGLVVTPHAYIEKGLYRLRHPAYIGAMLVIAGAGMMGLQRFGGAVIVVAALPFYSDRIWREERLRRGA